MEHTTFLPLLLITGLAFAVPLLAARLRRFSVPIVVLEILAGIIIGRSGFDWIEPSETLSFLGEFGFAYLMFLSGLEIDFNLLSTRRIIGAEGPTWKQPLPLAVIMFLGTLVLGLAGGFGLASLGLVQDPLLMGLILSTTSLGVVVPVLKEKNVLGSEFGQAILIQASIADFATLLLLTVAIALNQGGLELDLLLIPVLLLAFVLFARLGQEAAATGLIRRFLQSFSSATAQIRVRGAFALMVGWVVMAQAFGVELILGAFLAGAILGFISGGETTLAREKLEAIGYGFFIPIFFILVGVNFNFGALLASGDALLLMPILVVGAYIVKILPSLTLRFQFPWRASLAAGVLLSSRLSLIIAEAAIALDIGAISEAVNTDIILLAIITTSFSPILFNRMHKVEAAQERTGILLVGSDQMTEFLAKRLQEFPERVVILCDDPARMEYLDHLKADVIPLDHDLRRTLEAAGAAEARAIVDLSNSVENSRHIYSLAKAEFDIPEVVARTSDVDQVPSLQALGVRVVQPALATAMALEGALRFPSSFDVLAHQADGVEVVETVIGNPSLVNSRIQDLHLPGDALILSLTREGEVMVPHLGTRLAMGDRVALIGSPEIVQQTVRRLHQG
jgi:Kef-type K+ transport system membrane component KefB/Trk K+ transport system NAD-binding subunit